MPDLRYLGRQDVPSLIEYAQRAFRDRPEYDVESSQAFRVRGTDGEALLEAALAAPHWSYYPSLSAKAAVLHDRLNRNHPFLDGNKRFALTAMLVFLGRNNALLIADNDELLEFSIAVASGRLDQAAACDFAALRTFQRDWSGDEVDEWLARVEASRTEAARIAEALASWRQRPRFIELPGRDIESGLRSGTLAT